MLTSVATMILLIRSFHVVLFLLRLVLIMTFLPVIVGNPQGAALCGATLWASCSHLVSRQPLGPVFGADEPGGLGRVGGLHLLAVPIQASADADADHAGQADLGELAADVEIGKGLPFAAAGVEPFIPVVPGPRQGLGDVLSWRRGEARPSDAARHSRRIKPGAVDVRVDAAPLADDH